jgi:alanine racemase
MNYSPGNLEINLNNIAANYQYLSLIANSEIAFIQSKSVTQCSTIISSSTTVNYEGINELYLTTFSNNSLFNKEIAAVVKADAYGLGAKEISLKLYSIGCRKFFVAHLEEGIKLRSSLPNDAAIFILHGIYAHEEKAFIHYNLTPVINHLGQYNTWEACALSMNNKLNCILNFNTGMNRLDIPENEIPKIVEALSTNKALNPLYIMSHLSCADEIDNKYNKIQLERFNKIKQLFPNVKASFANSSAIFLGTEYHFDLLRPGMALYGLNPCPENLSNPMSQALSLKTKILQVKTITKKDFVGYGCAEEVDAGTVIATIAIGYADGYNRQLSHKGIVYIHNLPAKVIGRISMDLVTLDITNVPQEFHRVGQEVEIFGSHITPDSLARDVAGFNYEYLTSLGRRYKKNYIGG